jgi:putative transposase
VIYTTHATKSLNSLRKVLRNRDPYPNDKAIQKILCFALPNASKKWNRPIRETYRTATG